MEVSLADGALRVLSASAESASVDLPAGVPRRILLLRQDHIGDAIVSTGILRTLASVSDEIRIDVVASPANAALLARVPYVDQVHVFDKRRPSTFPRLALRLRSSRYDAVIDGMMTASSLTGLLVMMAAGGEHWVGIAGRGNEAVLTIPVPKSSGIHIIDQLGALTAPFGVDPAVADFRPELSLASSERDRAEAIWEQAVAGAEHRLVVNVSAGKVARRWPEERYAEVIHSLRSSETGLGVIVIGVPREWEQVVRVAAQSGATAVRTPALADAIALVATADLVVTPDTSIVHIATAFERPVVAMYRKDTGDEWGPYGKLGLVLESDGDTLESITVEALGDAVRHVFAKDRGARPDPRLRTAPGTGPRAPG